MCSCTMTNLPSFHWLNCKRLLLQIMSGEYIMSRAIMSYHKSSHSSIKVWLIHNDSDKTCLLHVAEKQNYALEKHKRLLFLPTQLPIQSHYFLPLMGAKIRVLKSMSTILIFKRLVSLQCCYTANSLCHCRLLIPTSGNFTMWGQNYMHL